MKANQKRLYEDFKKNAVEGKDGIIRERCKKAAAEILKSYPEFEKKEAPKKETKSTEKK